MKKILAAVAASALALSLSACGTSDAKVNPCVVALDHADKIMISTSLAATAIANNDGTVFRQAMDDIEALTPTYRRLSEECRSQS